MVTAATASLSALLGQYLITALQPLVISGGTNQLLAKLLGNPSLNISGIVPVIRVQVWVITTGNNGMVNSVLPFCT